MPPSVVFASILSIFGCTEASKTVEFPDLPKIHEKIENTPQKEHRTTEILDFKIALTGDVRGEIEPCGCPTLSYGGFARRQTVLENYAQDTVFQLDAGELLLKGFFANNGSDAQITQRADVIGKLSLDIGVDAWAVGPSDLIAVGIEHLQTMIAPKRISATWVDANNVWIFAPYTIVEKNGIRLGVIGLSDAITDPEFADTIHNLPATEAIQKTLDILPTDIDMVVLLGSVDDEEADAIAKKFPHLPLILTTEGTNYQDPRQTNTQPLIVESAKQGRFLEILHLRIPKRQPQNPLQMQITQGLSEQEWRNWLLLQQMQRNNPDTINSIPDTMSQWTNHNLYFSELVPLSSAYDPLTENNSSLTIKSFAEARVEQSKQIAEQPTTSMEPGFASSGTCAQCHSKELAKWSYSKHARAWESLLQYNTKHNTENAPNYVEATKNPECVACHTTGFGQVGGFGEISTSNIRKFKAVQCESCHGPMRGHPQDTSVHSIRIAPESCMGCHNEANSPEFDFRTYLPLATCQSDSNVP